MIMINPKPLLYLFRKTPERFNAFPIGAPAKYLIFRTFWFHRFEVMFGSARPDADPPHESNMESIPVRANGAYSKPFDGMLQKWRQA